MLISKLWNHEKEAVKDALACVMTIKEQGGEVEEGTINTLRAMIGLENVTNDNTEETKKDEK